MAAGSHEAIGEPYAIEKQLRQSQARPEERTAKRQRRSTPLLRPSRPIGCGLHGHATGSPKGQQGRVIDYTVALWPMQQVFVERCEVEIDNNGIENAIRPKAVGKKLAFRGREGHRQSQRGDLHAD